MLHRSPEQRLRSERVRRRALVDAKPPFDISPVLRTVGSGLRSL